MRRTIQRKLCQTSLPLLDLDDVLSSRVSKREEPRYLGSLPPRAVQLTYFFNRVLDHISDDGDGPCLAHADGPGNCLLLDRGIPLRFDDVHVVCGCQVQPVRVLGVKVGLHAGLGKGMAPLTRQRLSEPS